MHSGTQSSSIRLLSKEELPYVQGAHYVGSLILMLELPHIFMGIREFYNYLARLSYEGCEAIETEDHFTRAICSAKKNVTQRFNIS